MITYHQTFDIYHATYRIIRILQMNVFAEMERVRLRIFDFLYVFPHEIQNVKVPFSILLTCLVIVAYGIMMKYKASNVKM